MEETTRIQIKHRYTGAVLYEHEATAEQQASGLAMRAALDAAVESGANLGGADLGGANLRGAYLRGADLGDGIKLVGERPLLQIGPIGSRGAMLLVWLTESGVHVRTGCFFGSRNEFETAVAKTHGDSPHGREYTAALALIDAHAAEWMPAVEPTEAADEEAV